MNSKVVTKGGSKFFVIQENEKARPDLVNVDTGERLVLKTTYGARVWQAFTKDGDFIAQDGDCARLVRHLKELAKIRKAVNDINSEGLEDPSCTFCWTNTATSTIETRDGESETGICAACLAE